MHKFKKLKQLSLKPPNKGVTLIELTVVIATLLLLISVLSLLTNYYIKGADKSACLVNINAIQKSLRSYQNLNDLHFGDPIQLVDLRGPSKPFAEIPICPRAEGEYMMPQEQVPSYGQVAVICSDYDAASGAVDKTEEHNPLSTDAW